MSDDRLDTAGWVRRPPALTAADWEIIDLWVDHYPDLAPMADRARDGDGAAINAIIDQLAARPAPAADLAANNPDAWSTWRVLIGLHGRWATPVGLVEIADMLGVVRGTVDVWRDRGVLPEPRWTVGGRPAWAEGEIIEWAARTGRYSDSE